MLMRVLSSIAMALLASGTVATRTAHDVMPARSMRLAKKIDTRPATTGDAPPLLATLFQTHTDERVMLDDVAPSAERFDALLADRVTGQRHAIDPRLLDMLRALAKAHPQSRIEIVSGYRSEKLNEMLRKKGHHVASHSQHSLGHAVDFRIVDSSRDSKDAISPLAIESELRKTGWDGGIGVYLSESDWFTHVDVGPNRRWNGK